MHTIEVVPDLSPEVEVVRPDKDEVLVPENGQETISVKALDPDFKLDDVRLAMAVEGGKPLPPQAAARRKRSALARLAGGELQVRSPATRPESGQRRHVPRHGPRQSRARGECIENARLPDPHRRAPAPSEKPKPAADAGRPERKATGPKTQSRGSSPTPRKTTRRTLRKIRNRTKRRKIRKRKSRSRAANRTSPAIPASKATKKSKANKNSRATRSRTRIRTAANGDQQGGDKKDGDKKDGESQAGGKDQQPGEKKNAGENKGDGRSQRAAGRWTLPASKNRPSAATPPANAKPTTATPSTSC